MLLRPKPVPFEVGDHVEVYINNINAHAEKTCDKNACEHNTHNAEGEVVVYWKHQRKLQWAVHGASRSSVGVAVAPTEFYLPLLEDTGPESCTGGGGLTGSKRERAE